MCRDRTLDIVTASKSLGNRRCFSKYFDVIDHSKLLAFFEVVRGGSWWFVASEKMKTLRR